MDEDDDWKPYYATLSAKGGLKFFDEKEDAARDPENPLKRLMLDCVKSANRAPGIDFYDGVVDVEVYADNPNGADIVRIRPNGHAAMHNLLSAINIYKCPASQQPAMHDGSVSSRAATGQMSARGGQMTGRGGSPPAGGNLTSRGGAGLSERSQSGKAMRKQSSIGGGSGGFSFRSFMGKGRRESAMPSRSSKGEGGPRKPPGLALPTLAEDDGFLEEKSSRKSKRGGKSQRGSVIGSLFGRRKSVAG